MSGEIAKARSHAGMFYVGLGDQFDDDRRLVRETATESPSRNTSHQSWRRGSVDPGETAAHLTDKFSRCGGLDTVTAVRTLRKTISI
jgi:hypothetical protein